MSKVYRRLTVFAISLAVIASAYHAQAAGTKKTSAVRASALRTCSVLSSYEPPEHISTTIPYHTYSACMTKRGQSL
jgi:hypothetical protein